MQFMSRCLDWKYRTIKNLSKHNPHKMFLYNFLKPKKNLWKFKCRIVVINPDIVLITNAEAEWKSTSHFHCSSKYYAKTKCK